MYVRREERERVLSLSKLSLSSGKTRNAARSLVNRQTTPTDDRSSRLTYKSLVVCPGLFVSSASPLINDTDSLLSSSKSWSSTVESQREFIRFINRLDSLVVQNGSHIRRKHTHTCVRKRWLVSFGEKMVQKKKRMFSLDANRSEKDLLRGAVGHCRCCFVSRLVGITD